MPNGRPPRLDMQVAKPRRPQDFGWDLAHTQRVETLPEGGVLLRLSDRCVMIIGLPFVLPLCKFGRIPARGDLFKHMEEPRTEPAVP